MASRSNVIALFRSSSLDGHEQPAARPLQYRMARWIFDDELGPDIGRWHLPFERGNRHHHEARNHDRRNAAGASHDRFGRHACAAGIRSRFVER